MKVGLNAFFIDNPTIGMGQHTLHLVAELRVQMSAAETLTTLLPQPRTGQRSGRTGRLPAAVAKLWWEQVGIVQAASRERVDLLHTPYWTNPIAAPWPTVVTVHDVIQLVLPGYRRTLGARLYFALASAGARRAAAVLTVSQSAANDITRLLGVPASRVHVVGNGVHPDVGPVANRAQLAAVRARYALPQSYVLYLGGFEPRKNIARLVEAYALLPEAVQEQCALVLVSNVSSLPEIVGDAAVLVSPIDVSGIASGLEQLISNDALRDDLKKRGLQRAKQYAWAEVARRVLDVYRQIRG